MSATKNVGFLLKMSALKKYSKSKNTSAYIKCQRIQKQVCVLQYKLLDKKTAEMQAHTIRSASKLLLFGLGGLSTLLSFSVRLKFSF